MNLVTSIPKREVIATVKFLPALSITMPFTPAMTLKKNLDYTFKSVMQKVEAMLATNYSAEKAIPVIIKLRNLLSNLNYTTHKKSIAIFVSPVVEKVYYFDVELEEKIVIDPSFTISDLVHTKKEKKEYLILLLSNTSSKMYLGDGNQLTLIKSNKLSNVHQHENDTAAFLADMDNDLSIMLRSYPLPVFVMGQENILEAFRKITANDESFIEFINGDYEQAGESELGTAMQSSVTGWKQLKQQYLLKKVEKAKAANKLITGVLETLRAAIKNKGKLLLIEKGFMNSTQKSKIYHPLFKINFPCNELFFIKDEIDDIIRNVFENGGDVEFVDKGLLKEHMHIALL